jgi:hypothetical protein
MTDIVARTDEPSNEARMLQYLFGFMGSQAIAVAARLRIADLVAQGPKTLDELALTTQAHTSSLRRMLQLLSSLGIFEEQPDGRYRQTSLSATLRSDVPQSLRDYAIMLGSEFVWKSWGDLGATVVTGLPAFERTHGLPLFEYLTTHADSAAIFNAAMTSLSSTELRTILDAYDFSSFERIVDVGGGHGAFLYAILLAHPKLSGVLADKPSVVAGAAALRDAAVTQRCEIVGADFFSAVPEGADGYVAKSVIHDWNDKDALTILRNCRAAIKADGKLLLIERILKPANLPDLARFRDLQMLVFTRGGCERTEAEFRALLGAAHFAVTRVIPTAGPLSIIEGRPV